MRTKRRASSVFGWPGRAVVALSLAAYLGTTIGFPMPQQRAKRDGRPFPCQDHACGCSSAEQCWHNCCCYSAKQKLAWAREHQVTPPPEVVAEARCETAVAQAKPAAQKSCGSGCCHKKASPDADEHRVVSRKHRSRTHCESQEEKLGVTIVIGALARECRGLPTLWCATGAVAPPPAAVEWTFPPEVTQWLRGERCEPWEFCLSPPVPPPRV